MRIETGAEELEKTNHRSLVEKLAQEGSEDGREVQLPAALNREYRHDESGFLTGIDGAGEIWRYDYDGAGRLSAAGLTTRDVSVDIPYETDGAGNRVEAGVVFPAELVRRLDSLEGELRRNARGE